MPSSETTASTGSICPMAGRGFELVGLYPAAMSPCSVCRLDELATRLAAEEAREASAAARSDADGAARLLAAVVDRVGGTVNVRLTPLDSPRGLWLSLRHRLPNGLAVLVDGRHVAAEPEAVAAALRA